MSKVSIKIDIETTSCNNNFIIKYYKDGYDSDIQIINREKIKLLDDTEHTRRVFKFLSDL